MASFTGSRSLETRRAPPAAYFQMPAQSYEQASPLEATG